MLSWRKQKIHWVDIVFLLTFAFVVLWRGGKSIDATWILVGMATLAIGYSFFNDIKDKKKRRRSIPAIVWFAGIGFIVWTILSYIFSSTQNYGLDEIFRTTSLVLLFFWIIRKGIGTKSFPDDIFSQNFIRIAGIVTLFASSLGVAVYIFQPVNRFVGPFFDFRFHTDYWPNAWAQYLLLLWPIVFLWLYMHWSKKRKGVHNLIDTLTRTILFAFVLSTFFLSYSRGAAIAFGGQLLLLSAMVYTHLKSAEEWRKIGYYVLSVLVICMALFSSINELRSNLFEVLEVTQKVTFSADEGKSSVSERRQFWSQAINFSLEKPIFGWGPYSFRFVQPHTQSGVLATSDHPHNVFLKFAMERGVISMILFIFLIGFVLFNGIKKEINNKNLKEALPGLLLITALTGLLSHNLIDYNLQFVGISLPFWILLGFLFSRSQENKNIALSFAIFQRWIEVILVALMFLFAIYEGGYLVVSSFGRHAQAKGQYRTAMQWYERAGGEWFSRDLHLSKAQILFNDRNLTASYRSIDDYLDLNKEDARAWRRLGEVYEETRQYEESINAYNKAYNFGKWNDIGILLGKLRVQLKLNRQEEINKSREEIDDIIIKYTNAMMLNTHFILQSPNVDSFISLCELMAELYPDEAHVYYVYAARVDDHARNEREKIASRSPGFLW